MAGPFILSFVSLLGKVSVAEDGEGNVTAFFFPNQNLPAMEERETRVLSEASAQINEYLSGKRKVFDFSVSVTGSPFFESVMEVLRGIPYGEVRTYREVAELAGSPRAYRAAGTACASNPLPLVIPCHRVVPSSGGYGNYAGGTALKKRLVEFERDNND